MSRNHERNAGGEAVRILTRQEAERLFGRTRVLSTRLEHVGGELKIHLVFDNRDALMVKYRVRDHMKSYFLIRNEPCPGG
jgi:hypothetical protein